MLMITRGGLVREGRVITDRMFDYLNEECVLEPGLKFRDLVSMMSKYADLYTYLLTSGPWLLALVEEGLQDPVKVPDDGIQYLEVGWVAELTETLTDYTILHGQGSGGPFALDFSPLNTLGEYKLRLNTDYTVYRWSQETPILATSKTFTLLDILRGVFWELSFHGSPQQRDQRRAELEQTVQDLKDGKLETVEWKGVKDGDV